MSLIFPTLGIWGVAQDCHTCVHAWSLDFKWFNFSIIYIYFQCVCVSVGGLPSLICCKRLNQWSCTKLLTQYFTASLSWVRFARTRLRKKAVTEVSQRLVVVPVAATTLTCRMVEAQARSWLLPPPGQACTWSMCRQRWVQHMPKAAGKVWCSASAYTVYAHT